MRLIPILMLSVYPITVNPSTYPTRPRKLPNPNRIKSAPMYSSLHILSIILYILSIYHYLHDTINYYCYYNSPFKKCQVPIHVQDTHIIPISKKNPTIDIPTYITYPYRISLKKSFNSSIIPYLRTYYSDAHQTLR